MLVLHRKLTKNSWENAFRIGSAEVSNKKETKHVSHHARSIFMRWKWLARHNTSPPMRRFSKPSGGGTISKRTPTTMWETHVWSRNLEDGSRNIILYILRASPWNHRSDKLWNIAVYKRFVCHLTAEICRPLDRRCQLEKTHGCLQKKFVLQIISCLCTYSALVEKYEYLGAPLGPGPPNMDTS